MEISEIPPNLAKIHISPHLLCGQICNSSSCGEIFICQVLKSEIFPHDQIFLRLYKGDRGDTYQVCTQILLKDTLGPRVLKTALPQLKYFWSIPKRLNTVYPKYYSSVLKWLFAASTNIKIQLKISENCTTSPALPKHFSSVPYLQVSQNDAGSTTVAQILPGCPLSYGP